LAHAIIGPRPLALGDVALELLGAELVVDKSAESDAVAESLEWRDGIEEDDHGCDDEEDILEDSREGENESGSFADLELSMDTSWKYRRGGGRTRKTTDKFSKKATVALIKKVKSPTSRICCMDSLGTSKNSATRPFIKAQTGAK
jgi:hypothetical protein